MKWDTLIIKSTTTTHQQTVLPYTHSSCRITYFFLTLLIPTNSFKTGKSYFTEKSLFSKKMFVSIEIQDFISLTKVPKLESCSHTLHLKGEAGFSLEGPMQSTWVKFLLWIALWRNLSLSRHEFHWRLKKISFWFRHQKALEVRWCNSLRTKQAELNTSNHTSFSSTNGDLMSCNEFPVFKLN